ncbi:MAG: D-glycero-beta-D-manno-heptose 1-phosphate adenylyltransferase [Planctomycetota bacterium]
MDQLLEAVGRWKPFRAVVLGDFMLDQVLSGDASRLSPDAPVPVLHVTKSHDRPGGAANLCLDLVALRGEVIAVGVIGRDDEGARLRAALDADGVGLEGLVEDASRPTTVKRSLVGLAQARHPQKMFRVDFESTIELSSEIEDALFARVEAELAAADVLCIEDYGKGVCSPALCQRVIVRCREAGVPVFVDPARIEDYARYRGATAITPNRTEAELATGMRTLESDDESERADHNATLAHRLLDEHGLGAVVLTLDKHGSLLLESGGTPAPIPTIARAVYDVTGAGDMMLAALAAARANGIGWEDSVRFANTAAGLEVEIFGVEPIPLDRVHHELLVRYGKLDGKVRTRGQLALEVRLRRSAGERVVFTNGCFDILHAGHVRILQQARELGDFLVVGLNTDESVSKLKGPDRPVNCEQDRAAVLAGLESVGAVCLFGEDTPAELIAEATPDVLVKGQDYEGKPVAGREEVEAAGGRVELLPLVQGRSTTAVVEKLRGT